MQLHGLNGEKLILASEAEKGKTYTCPECQKEIRSRSGHHRRPHFFHLKADPKCRQSQKGLIHLYLQQHLQELLQNEGAEMEKIFPQIGRIADIACMKTKKIFEIQYSPISINEAKARCKDYESLGFTLIWILHDHTFNQVRMRPAEFFLRNRPCYFSNWNLNGKGEIYDQLEYTLGKRRIHKSKPYKIHLDRSNPLTPIKRATPFIKKRIANWPLYHEGDLFDHYLKNPRLFSQKKPSRFSLKESYFSVLHMLLERSSK